MAETLKTDLAMLSDDKENPVAQTLKDLTLKIRENCQRKGCSNSLKRWISK